MADDEAQEDPRNKLTLAQATHVQDWLRQKGNGVVRPCAVCGQTQWQIGAHVVAPMNLSKEGGVLIGGTVYPFVPLMCTNCGNTQFINAAIMKLPKAEGESS